MERILTLNGKEQKRLVVMNGVEKGTLKVREAAEVLDISERQGWRLLAAYRKEGAAGFAHGNRGRKPGHAVVEEIRKQVIELAQGRYEGCNQQHFTELLGEREGIRLHRSTVRRILAAAGIRSPNHRRAPKHRRRRERYGQEGLLLQIDGSPENWLGERGPWLTLVAAIDDATGKLPGAIFREQEDAQGYFLLMEQIVRRQGIPLAVYRDGHGVFEHSKKESETLEEQLEGGRRPTQFGRLLRELGVKSIPARSPQAKGRIERLFKTLKSRLVSEMRLAGVKTLEEANRFLKEFLPRFNRRFAVPARESGVAYRPVGEKRKLKDKFCFKYWRRVGGDNVVSFGEERIQIYPTNGRQSYARAKVEIRQAMSGRLSVYYHDICLAIKPAPPEAPVLRLHKMGREGFQKPKPKKDPLTPKKGEPVKIISKTTQLQKPAPNHPWKIPWKKKRPPRLTFSLDTNRGKIVQKSFRLQGIT
jgi:transposase